MSDSITLNPGSGGAPVATDKEGTLHYQKFKIYFGADGSFSPVQTASPLPVTVVSGNLTVDGGTVTANAGTGNFSMNLAQVNGSTHASGNPIFAQLVAGSTQIGKVILTDGSLDASIRNTGSSDSLNVSVVDGSGNQVTSFGGGTQYAVDTAAGGTDSGFLSLVVRDDALSTLTPADGDYTQMRVDSTGRLWCNVANTVTVASHAVTNAGTFAVQVDGDALTSLQTLDNAISGAGFNITQLGGVNVSMNNGAAGTGVLRVTLANDSTGVIATVGAVTAITNALPAGTNNIGDVDVLTVPADPFGANADAASATGSISAKLRFIASTGIPITGTVTVGSHAVTNAGTFAVQVDGAALTALQLIDDVVYVDDADWTDDTSKHVLVGGVYQSSPHTVTDGDVTPFLTDANGRLTVSVGNTVTVASHAVTNAGTFVVQENGAALTALQVIDDWDESDRAKVNPIVGQAGVAAGAGAVGATVQRMTLASDDPAVALLGTIDTDTGNIATSVSVMDDWDNGASDGCSVSGDVAHGTADAGEPVKIGAKVETSLKGITLEADGDRTNLYADSDGVQVMKLNTTGADFISEAVSNTDGNSTAFTNFSAVANTYNNITSITVFRTDAGTSMAYIDFRDGTTGSVLWRMPLPAGGGSTLSLGGLPIFKTSANTALAFDVSSALTTVYISISGYQSKV